MIRLSLVIFSVFLISACAPEIGSDDWCKELKEKSKADWTVTEAKDYAKNCIF